MPALVGHLPDDVVIALRAFLDFCYLVRRSSFTDDTLSDVETALERFHEARKIFQDLGIRESFSVPRLHSMLHYKKLIRLFGAPNGLCSSITESKHIDAVKKPWRRSNRYNALGQMLKTISRLDKLRASRISFKSRGMLQNIFLNFPMDEDADNILLDDTLDETSNKFEGLSDDPTVLGSVKLANTPRA